VRVCAYRGGDRLEEEALWGHRHAEALRAGAHARRVVAGAEEHDVATLSALRLRARGSLREAARDKRAKPRCDKRLLLRLWRCGSKLQLIWCSRSGIMRRGLRLVLKSSLRTFKPSSIDCP
jgi:hypothetical protein